MSGRDTNGPQVPSPSEYLGFEPEELAGANVVLHVLRSDADDFAYIDEVTMTVKLMDGTKKEFEIPQQFQHPTRDDAIDEQGVADWLGIELDPHLNWREGRALLGHMPGPPPPDGEPAPLFGVTEQGMLDRKIRLKASDPSLTRVDLILELDGNNETSMQMPRRFVKKVGDTAFIDFETLLPWLGIPHRDFNPSIREDMVERDRGIALGGVGPASINVPPPPEPKRSWRPVIIVSSIFGMVVVVVVVFFFTRGSDPDPFAEPETSATLQAQGTSPPDTTAPSTVTSAPPPSEDEGMIEYRWVSDVLISSDGAYEDSGMDDAPDGDSWSQKGKKGTPDKSSSVAATNALVTSFSVEYAGVLFNQSSFPCGGETSEYRVTCPAGAGKVPAGEVFVVATALEGPVAGGSGQYTYGVAFDDDGNDADNYHAAPPFDADFFDNSEVWYTLQIDPDGSRHVWSGGIVDGAVGYPRYSAAAAIEWGDTVVWVIPRSEVPGESPAYRTTAFVNNGDLADVPSPDSAGGDVSGFAVSDALIPIDTEPADVTGIAHLADVEGTVERVDVAPGEEEAHLAQVLISTFEERLNAALDAGDDEAVMALVHPAMLQGPNGQQCRDLMNNTIIQAVSISVTTYPLAPDTGSPVAVYQPIADVIYPTGTVEFAPLLAVGTAGQLGMVFPSCA